MQCGSKMRSECSRLQPERAQCPATLDSRSRSAKLCNTFFYSHCITWTFHLLIKRCGLGQISCDAHRSLQQLGSNVAYAISYRQFWYFLLLSPFLYNGQVLPPTHQYNVIKQCTFTSDVWSCSSTKCGIACIHFGYLNHPAL